VKSIRATLTLGLLAGLALLLAGGGAALYFNVRAALLREFDSTLRAKAEALATLTKRDGERIELEFAEELMPEFAGSSHPAYFQLWRPDGNLLERSPSLRRTDLPRRAGQAGTPLFWDLTLPDGRPGRAIGYTFIPQVEEDAAGVDWGKLSLPATVVVARERHDLDRHLRIIASAICIFAGVMAAGAAALALVVIRLALTPLARLTDDVSHIDAGTLDSRIPADRLPTELKPICLRLNELLARLQSAFERERSFSANVSHELRTPVAELRALAELALKWPADGGETRETFTDALAIAEQMETIVSGLLVIARCESGIEIVQHEPIALDPLVRELWHPLAAQAEHQRVTTRLDLPWDAVVESDRALLRIILKNLFSNAADYTPDGGELSISTARDGEVITLRIANTAANLTPADLPHFFERFWRKNDARTSSPHAGLGLAISQSVAQLLGTQLRAEITELGMLVITLKLPSTKLLSDESRHASQTIQATN
jgi:two-component system sensor histidine kinase QseC